MSWIKEAIKRLEQASKAYQEANQRRKALLREDPTGGRRQETLAPPDDFSVQAKTIVRPKTGKRKIRPKPQFQTRQPDKDLRLPRCRTVVIFHTSDAPDEPQTAPISSPLADWLGGGGIPTVQKKVFQKTVPHQSLVKAVNNAQRRHRNPSARIK